MIQNAATYTIRILEVYVREALALRSVPPDVLRDELQDVRDRVGELIGDVERNAQRSHEATQEGHALIGTERIATGVSAGVGTGYRPDGIAAT